MMLNDEKEKNLFGDFESSSYEEWKQAAEKLLKGVPFDKKMYTQTPEGIRLEPIYNLEMAQESSADENFPGYENFRRGTDKTGYLNPAWTLMQEESEPVAQKWNENCLKNLQSGVDGINICLSSQSKDCRLPADKEAVDVDGLSLKDFADFNNAMQRVELSEHPIYMDCGINGELFLSVFHAFLKENGCPLSSLTGTLGNDPMGRLVQSGVIHASFDEVFDSLARIIRWKKDEGSNVRSLIVDTTHYHNAGASAVEELAYAFSTARLYIEQLLERGIDIDDIAGEFTFSFSVSSTFFMEIAKLRAAKLIWTNVIDAYGGNSLSKKIKIHAKTSPRTQTVYDPYVNMLRDTSQAFSAVLGGIDSLHVSPFDERGVLSSAFAKRVAKNVQLILKDECHLTMPIDPVGGTWYIEKLTDQLALKAWEKFQSIEEVGGIFEYYIKGLVQVDLKKSREFRQREFTSRKRGIVGNNMYPNLSEAPLYIDEDKSNQIKAEIFKQVQDMAQGQEKAETGISHPIDMEKLAKAVKNGYCFQSLSKALFKASTQLEPLKIHNDAHLFEELRKMARDIRRKTGTAPKLFCANFSKLAIHKPRTDFTKGFFEVGGFEVISDYSFEDVDQAVEKALESKAKVIAICSSDKVYPQVVIPFTRKLKERDKGVRVILAGKPAKEMEEAYTEAGLDDFIFVKTDIYEFLKKALSWDNSQGGEGLA